MCNDNITIYFRHCNHQRRPRRFVHCLSAAVVFELAASRLLAVEGAAAPDEPVEVVPEEDATSSSGSLSSPSSRSAAVSREPLLAFAPPSPSPPLPPNLPLELLIDDTPAAFRNTVALIASTSRANRVAVFCGTTTVGITLLFSFWCFVREYLQLVTVNVNRQKYIWTTKK